MPQNATRVRVVVADDKPLYRDGVVRALRAVGRASDRAAAVAEAMRRDLIE